MSAGIAEQEHQALVTAYGRLQRIAESRSSAAAMKAWRLLSGVDLDGSWQERVGPMLVRILTAGQLLAASSGQTYVDQMVAADGLAPDYAGGAGRVQVRTLAGTASDGRALDTLLEEPLIGVKTLMAGGMTLTQAMLHGQNSLLRIMASEVADAGRGAAGIAMAANRTVTGYVRCIRPGACARCAILAGRWYHYNADFDRHPRCQCYGVPSTKGRRGAITSPTAYFNGLSRTEQGRIFTLAGAQAIRDGADIYAVVNARRKGSLYTFTDTTGLRRQATREGATRRSLYQQRARREQGLVDPRNPRSGPPAGPRLTPEAIYRMARSRSQVIELLHRYAYLY
ncbi:VG15 protein [Streptomyces sp. 8L]|uniref:VG15 protein n=1 Tax=Streptomyces sp. 8L TaxID=2877242 RepID=UPI001CD61BB0|nr:hypothetical protein [Streptomyces sp. 8L]MCA1218692.1 hypothetical protein [Streptomyces sp. 8L]